MINLLGCDALKSVIELLNQYGYIILFSALLLELIAFPLPGEVIMTYCGFLVFEGKMNWIISILVATFGATLGITISYFTGTTLGYEFFKKYGSYIHLGPERLKKTSTWFNTYGNTLLIVAYFIPGVRHVTGYFSGIIKIPYKKFALNAYLGALIWSCTFISLGKTLGQNWDKFHGSIIKYAIIGSLIIASTIITIYFYKKYKIELITFTFAIVNKIMNVFHSLGKLKIALACMSMVFLGFFAIVISLIHKYLAHDFDDFDTVTTYLVKNVFTEDWSYFMNLIGKIASIEILIPLTVLILILIIIKNADKYLEILFLIIIIGGGEALQTILRLTFGRLGPKGLSVMGTIPYTFPSDKSFMAVVAYGLLCFMILRHRKRISTKTVSVFITLFICILASLNPLFFESQFPSDVFAGYAFGGVWLTLNILLLEIYRMISKIYQ